MLLFNRLHQIDLEKVENWCAYDLVGTFHKASNFRFLAYWCFSLTTFLFCSSVHYYCSLNTVVRISDEPWWSSSNFFGKVHLIVSIRTAVRNLRPTSVECGTFNGINWNLYAGFNINSSQYLPQIFIST